MKNLVKYIFTILLPFLMAIILLLGSFIAFTESIIWGIILLIVSIFLFIVASKQNRKFKTRCSVCGKWNAMSVINKELIEKKDTNKTKTLVDKKYRHGELIEKKERQVIVPAIKYTYRITEKCSFCNHIETYRTEKIEEK